MYAGFTSLGVHELKIKNYTEKKVILCVTLNSEAEALRKSQSKKK